MIGRTMRTLWLRLRNTIRRGPRDLEFQEEIADHIRLLAERYRRSGMTPDASMLAARRQFGNAVLLQEDRMALQTIPAIDRLRGDLIYSVRVLRKSPGFAAAAVATLGLGIGANTAIFSVCSAVLFKPLPYLEPDRIVMLWEQLPGGVQSSVAPANFVDWRTESRSFTGMAAVASWSFILGGQAEPARLAAASVSAGFFSVLGVSFTLGRDFALAEERTGQHQVAILSHGVWQERFGGDAGVVGREIILNDSSYRIVGVLPAGFQFASSAADFQARNQPDIWVPLVLDPQKLPRGTHPR
jgi:putative ABC transport system permease protein